MKVYKLLSESVKFNFQEKKVSEKLSNINETVQNEVEVVWRHLKSVLVVAATNLCRTLRMFWKGVKVLLE